MPRGGGPAVCTEPTRTSQQSGRGKERFFQRTRKQPKKKKKYNDRKRKGLWEKKEKPKRGSTLYKTGDHSELGRAETLAVKEGGRKGKALEIHRKSHYNLGADTMGGNWEGKGPKPNQLSRGNVARSKQEICKTEDQKRKRQGKRSTQ